ncbi:MAG TPA: alpha/beta fold hydrolase [Acidimicrobiales bacterium]|nr:alpha/beta fold hydrolase [Acidimicrobiales bacterium]
MTPVERLVVDELPRLPQFCHAGLTEDLVFVSGTLGVEHDSLVAGGVGPQTTRALENLGRILQAAGASWDDVVKVSVYLADMAEFPAMNEAYGTFFPGVPPARITVGGVGLALGARVEIECVARRRAPARRGGNPPERRTGFVDHDGERIYYETVGSGGVPLVLSHGAGGNHAVWYQQVAPFARDRMVITWDHRGFGRSSDLGGRSGPQVAAGDLLAVLDHLGVSRADLVGQSMGGWSVVGAALARPSLARSLVLADTLGGFTSGAIAAGLERRRDGARGTPDVLGRHPALDPSFSECEPERAHLYQSLGRMGSADLAVILPRLLDTTHDESDAARLGMPVLCVVGDRDPLFPPASVRALADLLPDARVVEISGCGHSPYFEDAQAWNAAVRQFLSVLDAGEGIAGPAADG